MTEQTTSSRQPWAVGTLVVCLVGGLLFVASATTSRGSDLRPTGSDLRSVVADRTELVDERRAEAAELDADVARLTASAPPSDLLDEIRRRIESLGSLAGLARAQGPGTRVVLDDAPRDVAQDDEVDPNVLVVHEQDIRAFVNALWAGGAEAVSLQGQRIVSTSSITCVGSTVVIDGVPYAPPYVIEAVGDAQGMSYSIGTSPQTLNFQRYAQRYGLGLELATLDDVDVAAYEGTVALRHARALRQDPVPADD
ncbi:DUF881 domain-containing protein [Aeromicrobium sp. CF4.19]|uniref:DUF881 domain-containing protein n=1 Tax=Aeromicrobium sp. CF4.19 TaxID=3373082 RepID=UPI003EE465A1